MPALQAARAIKASGEAAKRSMAGAAAGSPDAGGIRIDLRCGAPKIILPIDCSADSGALLLDTGVLTVKGFLGGGAGPPRRNRRCRLGRLRRQWGRRVMLSEWQVALRNINSRLAVSSDLYGTSRAGTLLQNFDILLGVRLHSPVVAVAATTNGSNGSAASAPPLPAPTASPPRRCHRRARRQQRVGRRGHHRGRYVR